MQNNFQTIKDYLNSFINYERDASFFYTKNLKLKRVRHLLKTLNIPYKKLKVIHIAGTKGKSSTAHFCADILAASGYKAGLYTSPHLYDFRERIIIKTTDGRKGMQKIKNKREETVRSEMISKNDVVRIVEEIKPILEKLRNNKELGRLTFFEVYTAIAFKYFIERKVDFAVLETGLGGRLDATNVIKPAISIITHIGYDHTDKLGNKLEEIAYEKAGIVKRYIPVISARQRKSAVKVIKQKCFSTKSPLFFFDKDFSAKDIKLSNKDTSFNFSFDGTTFNNLKIFLKGMAQVENVSLSLAAILLLKDKKIIQRNIDFGALCRTFIEGRFEIIDKKYTEGRLVIMDVAHNPSSFSVLRKNLEFYYPSREIILIFAVSSDKDFKKMLKEINYRYIILTRFNNPRSLSPLEIKEKCHLENAFIAGDIKNAFAIAKKLYNKNSLIIISGSLFLVSEAKMLFNNEFLLN